MDCITAMTEAPMRWLSSSAMMQLPRLASPRYESGTSVLDAKALAMRCTETNAFSEEKALRG